MATARPHLAPLGRQRRRRPALVGLLLVPMMLVGGVAGADFSVEEEAGAFLVTASNAERAEVVAALLEGLDIEIVGEDSVTGEISGRFEGDLSRILNVLAPESGFVITYRQGRPARIIFSKAGLPPATGTLETWQDSVSEIMGTSTLGEDSDISTEEEFDPPADDLPDEFEDVDGPQSPASPMEPQEPQSPMEPQAPQSPQEPRPDAGAAPSPG
jgi:hypothetical protein